MSNPQPPFPPPGPWGPKRWWEPRRRSLSDVVGDNLAAAVNDPAPHIDLLTIILTR